MPKTKLPRVLLASAIALTLGAFGAGCAGSGGGGGKGKSQRAKWIASPTSGSTEADMVKIPGLAVSFGIPSTLYVYKQCGEAAHSPQGEDKWVPVIVCQSGGGEEVDELAEDNDGPLELKIFVAEKTVSLNERGTTILENDYRGKGYDVVSVEYFDEYQGKAGRRGIEVKYRIHDKDDALNSREVHQFYFPRGDVVFIAQVDFPLDTNQAGIANDWQRILWGFQLDEDGPLYDLE